MSADGSSLVWSPNSGPGVISYINGSWSLIENLPKYANVCSDRVNPNIFYAYAEHTLYVSNDGGATFTAKYTSEDMPESSKIKAVPGEEGHVWIPGSGSKDISADEAKSGLWYTTDGGTTLSQIDNVKRSDVVGFGAGKEGADCLAVYAVLETEGVNGVYRSDNYGKSWIRVNDDAHQ